MVPWSSACSSRVRGVPSRVDVGELSPETAAEHPFGLADCFIAPCVRHRASIDRHLELAPGDVVYRALPFETRDVLVGLQRREPLLEENLVHSRVEPVLDEIVPKSDFLEG